jgi:molybdate transport system regulatory protein
VVAAVDEGAVNSEVVVDLAEGKTLVATITRQSAHDLDLRPGAPVTALVKASQVILAVE